MTDGKYESYFNDFTQRIKEKVVLYNISSYLNIFAIINVFSNKHLIWIQQSPQIFVPMSSWSGFMWYYFTARWHSLALHVHHNKPAPRTSSAASGVVSAEPPLTKKAYNGYNTTITVVWTMSSVKWVHNIESDKSWIFFFP